MKKFFSFESVLFKLQNLLKRFPIAVLMVIGFAVIFFLEINNPDYKFEINYRWHLFFGIGTILAFTVALWSEDLKTARWKQILITLGIVLLWGVYCYFLPENKADIFRPQILPIVVIGATAVVSAFFISFLRKNQNAEFWNFSQNVVSQIIISVAFAGILYAGLALALFSIENLFNVKMSGKPYQNLAVCCFILFAVNYFLANIYSQTEKHIAEISFHKVFKIFGLYIILPILGIYMLILYAYLVKILIAWELPDGWVSKLVSALVIGGLLGVMILYPLNLAKENKLAAFFSRWFGVLTLPLVVLMSVAVLRRISDYGYTINRLYLITMNFWFYGILLYLFLTKSRHIKWILISPVVIVLLATFGPWRFSNISKNYFTKKLEKNLSSLTFLKNGKISLIETPKNFEKLDTIRKKEISGVLDYLIDTYGVKQIQPFFAEDISEKRRYEIMKLLNLENNTHGNEYFNINVENFEVSDINNYKSFIYIDFYDKNDIEIKNNQLVIEHQNKQKLYIPLKTNALNLLKEDDSRGNIQFSSKNPNFSVKGNDYVLYIKGLSGYTVNDSIEITGFSGFLFYK
ncbi:MAG: DUF4153 domain-containing protein [Flavobacteriaceae bacterium]|jgi:hypothetical protein|nr:DUF4153 domain-containing protein [Flavobacteriaceae bacterium]